MSIGKNITMFRKAKGLTQAELGELLGVSNQAVSKWESEMTMPDIMLLPEIAKVLGVTLDDLYGEHKEYEIVDKVNSDTVTDKRILLISVKEENTNIKLRIPVQAVHSILSNDIFKKAIPDEAQIDELFKMIESGAKGTLVDVDEDDVQVTISVEDHED
ncbi:MAG: helix-turn-helix transcriptional regulator [Clostridia bacterium]|nr:helix-turn-helix transcriptional regulator [Clostridia bacterium]